MKVLVIKLTSMGDVIHTLPALTDAQKIHPSIKFDFVVEESFKEIPAWHSAVDRVIPVATRRWRKNLFASRMQIKQAYKELSLDKYDCVIDLQGLLKSAILSLMTNGSRHGYDANSIREPLAARLYRHKHPVSKSLHAISRIRHLTAKSLDYFEKIDHDMHLDYGLNIRDISDEDLDEETRALQAQPFVVFLHGTTWVSKEWPLHCWQELAKKVSSSCRILLPWGSDVEYQRACDIAAKIDNVEVLPKLSLSAMAHVLNNAVSVVSVDTGLGHLCAALGKPTISIYGPTDTKLVGTRGENQQHLCATDEPNWSTIKKNQAFDYGKVTAERVFENMLIS